MNTHDMIELPPLPRPQVPRIDADIDLMDIRRLALWCEKTAKDYAIAAIEADRQRRGEPAFYVNARIFDPTTGKIKTDVNDALTWSEKPAGNWQVPVYTAPQPAFPAQVQHVDDINVADIHAVSAEHATLNLQPSSSMQPVATAFFTEKGEVAFTGLFDRTLKALEAVKTTRMGISSGSIDLYAAPQAAEPMKVPSDEAIAILKLALEYWADRQQRYKNRAPVWVTEARALLSKYAAPQPQQTPKGYKLVPIEPTPEMLKSGWAENDVPLALRWKAMLEAAPEEKP